MRRIRLGAGTDPQHEFWESPAKYRYFRGGVGSGKTLAGVVEAMRMPAGSTGMVLAPTFPMLRDATLRTFLEVARRAGVLADYLKGDNTAILKGGRTVFFRTAGDPDRLRGPNLGWFWIDEAAMVKPQVWPIMLGRHREAPRRAWCTSTPRGKNWVHDTFEQGGRKYRLIKASSRTNIFQPASFVESMAENYTHDFARQEIDGEVMEDTQEALRLDFWLDRLEHEVRDRFALPGRRRMGVDLGYGTGRDSFTCLIRDDLGILWATESPYVGVAEAAHIMAEQSYQWSVRQEDITYDAGGPGRDMVRYLPQYGIHEAVPYYGSQSGGPKHGRRRDRVAWRVRERLDPQRPQLWTPHEETGRHPLFPVARAGLELQPGFALPDERPWWPRLAEELKALKYAMKDRKVVLEKKEDLMARLKRSPNILDALLMTFNDTDEAA